MIDIERKIKTGKKWIFAAVLVGSVMAIWSEILAPRMFPMLVPDPFSVSGTIVGVFISAAYIYGLYLCSRAVGIPLTVDYYLSLSLGFPCWIPISMVVLCRFLFA